MPADFPPRLDNKFYLTEAGVETEVMYKWGLELPEFAMFPLLDDPEADEVIRNMYRRYFEVAAEHQTGLLLNGHDYRASPDWAAKLGYDADGLRQMQHRVIRLPTAPAAKSPPTRPRNTTPCSCRTSRGQAPTWR